VFDRCGRHAIGYRPMKKRPRDPAQLAKLIVDIGDG
jgi:hypothetical protein